MYTKRCQPLGNIVKADNWFEDVQQLIDDPQYAVRSLLLLRLAAAAVHAAAADPASAAAARQGFFLKFDPARLAANATTSPPCDDNYNPPKCSPFYHDQTLVPNVPVRNRWTDLHVDRAFLDFGSSPWAQV